MPAWHYLEKAEPLAQANLLYDKLIMVGDIISENSGGTYRCPSRHTIQISDDLKALLGVYDMTGNVMSLPISGMMLSAREHGKPQVERNPAWWNLPREYHVWSSCTDERVYEYADPFRQNVRDCWATRPTRRHRGENHRRLPVEAAVHPSKERRGESLLGGAGTAGRIPHQDQDTFWHASNGNIQMAGFHDLA